MANYAVLSGLSYGCDSVTVPPQPELSSVCQTVIQKCPGLISIEESDGGAWEEQEYEESTGDHSFPDDNQESVNWASNPGDDDLYLNDEVNDSDEGDEDFFGDDSDDEEDESWY